MPAPRPLPNLIVPIDDPTHPLPRLDLFPMTPPFLQASLEGNLAEAMRHLPASLPDGWPGEHSWLLKIRLPQLEKKPELQPWLVRAMVDRSLGAMVGFIGFHGPPGDESLKEFSPNAAEFGFTVLPPYRRQGYAQEASLALMQWATREHGVTEFVLTISPDNFASQALAAKLGFVRIGSHMDESDGPEDVLERRVAASLS